MNLYPEHLRFAAAVCEALNKIESDNASAACHLGSIEIKSGDDVIGECRDDDGVGYSFHVANQ